MSTHLHPLPRLAQSTPRPTARPSRTSAPSTSDPPFAHARADILGVNVSAIDMPRAVEITTRWLATGGSAYICLTGVHGIMEAQSDPALRHILHRALINAPDGMPLSWVGHLQGHAQMDRVFGPDFMAEICRLSVAAGLRHFLYGGRPGVAEALKSALQTKFPGLQIVGVCTPPFTPLTPQQQQQLLAEIHSTQPDIVWVGLSTPKQERFMAEYLDRLRVPLLVGVGAAFDYHTGRIRDAPAWIKRAGLQWLHRLLQDPRRLWRRYLRNNPAFLCRIARQLLRQRRCPPSASTGLANSQDKS